MKQKHFLILSIICFSISLILISLYSKSDNEPEVYGWQILVFGWFGIFNGNSICLCWLANPALIMSWFMIRKLRISLILSIIAFILSMVFYFYLNLNHIADEVDIKSGNYFWTASIVIMIIGNFMKSKKINASR
jgi:MFS family permease